MRNRLDSVRTMLAQKLVPEPAVANDVASTVTESDPPSNKELETQASVESAIEIVRRLAVGPTGAQRVAMTLSCTDCDDIDKVADAGQVLHDAESGQIQIMHTGLKVVHGGYYGDWMSEIIIGLQGHHEPQEERVFYEVLARIENDEPAMIEVGCFWAYYSLWFLQRFADGIAVSVEPDPDHLDVGRANASLNGLSPCFMQAASGGTSGIEIQLSSELRTGVVHTVETLTIDDLMTEHGLTHLDVLHIDIQGFELETLQATEERFRANAIRFVIVSTHHHLILGDALTHEHCLEWLQSVGAHIIAEHSVAESFSGDGLIAASFDARDDDFTVELSHNRSSTSLFESPLLDLDRLMEAYEDLRVSDGRA